MSHFAATDGTCLYFDDWGEGPPMVFASAVYLNSQMWEYQRPYLASRGLRCIAYDRRGHGRSDRPWTGYDFDTLADDLAALLDHLDLREVTLVGYSLGGGEVIRYLSRHGTGRIARVALVAAVTPFLGRAADNPDGVDPAIVAASARSRQLDRPRWFAENAGFFFGDAPVSPELVDWGVRMCLDATPKATAACIEAAFTTDFRAELPALAVPTLVVHGSADLAAPVDRCGRRTAALVPDATYREYAGAPHGLAFTHPDRLNEDLLSFVMS